MRYKEFEKKIEDWGEKYDYKPVVEVDSECSDYYYFIEVAFGDDDDNYNRVCAIHKSERFVIDLNWGLYKRLLDSAKRDLFKIATEFAETKPEEREYEDSEELKNAIDSIINRLEVIQTDTEDVMNWTIEEIQERSWNLRNNLEDIIIDLEKVQEAN